MTIKSNISVIVLWAVLLLNFLLASCSHPLKTIYKGTLPQSITTHYISSCVGINPYLGTDRYHEICYNAIINGFEKTGCFRKILPHFKQPKEGTEVPKIIMDFDIDTHYGVDRGINFFIQWPGFIVFAPLWHGLVYSLDIYTTVNLSDYDTGKLVATKKYHDAYKIKYTSSTRGVITGFPVGWITFGAISLFSNAYIAWSDNMKDVTYDRISPTYGKIMAQRIIELMRTKNIVSDHRVLLLPRYSRPLFSEVFAVCIMDPLCSPSLRSGARVSHTDR